MKPQTGEYPPYFKRYIDLAGSGELSELLYENTKQAEEFFLKISGDMGNYRYAPGKWSVKEVLMHLADMERVFAYRALICIRGEDTTILHPVDENIVASNVDVNSRNVESVWQEFSTVRTNSEILFKYMTEKQGCFLGNARPHKFSARALGYMMIGHVKHHIQLIKERYLPAH